MWGLAEGSSRCRRLSRHILPAFILHFQPKRWLLPLNADSLIRPHSRTNLLEQRTKIYSACNARNLRNTIGRGHFSCASAAACIESGCDANKLDRERRLICRLGTLFSWPSLSVLPFWWRF